MKKILLSLLLLSDAARALPILNENMANSAIVTIYADHLDTHHFYIVPNVVTIATGQDGKPIFSYASIRQGLFSEIGIMQMAVVPAFTDRDLTLAEKDIMKKDPDAKFSGVPFIDSKLSLNGQLRELILENDCNHPAGVIGQEQACSLTLTPKGRSLFFQSIAERRKFASLQFDYSLQGVVRKADNTFADEVVHHGMAIEIDGGELAKYPELISK